MTPCTLVQRQRRFGWTWFLRLRSFFSTEDEGIRSLRNVGIFHTRCMFQPNTTICYTKLCSRQHVSTLMSHHQAIQRTNPRYIIHWSAFWDPKILQWVVQLIAVVKKESSRPQGHSAIGRILCQWKIQWHQLGSNQRPFRFVAQHLNHCATAVPL